jgi:hypothetical protein
VTARQGPGEVDKAAAEAKTADVAAKNAEHAERQRTDAEQARTAGRRDGDGDDATKADVAAETDDTGASLRIGTDQTPGRDDDAPERAEGHDAAVDPYPAWETLDVDELRAVAEARDVVINRDVEKAELIQALRRADGTAGKAEGDVAGASNPYASYDVMPVDRLRELAKQRDVELPDEFVKAHLITELRAADSGVNTGGGTTV